MDSSDEDDALPGWMTDYTSPDMKKGRLPVIGLSSSDDESPKRQPSPTHEEEPQTLSTPAAEPQPEDVKDEQAAAPSAAPATAKPASTSKKRALKPAASAKPATAGSKAAAGAKTSAGTKAGPSSAAQSAGTAAAAAPEVAAGDDAAAKAVPKPITAAVAGELPVMIPEKLVQTRMIAELESLEGGATDLTGDSGAVGRILVREDGDSKQMQLDLKGIVYNAVHAPLASTLCVVNIGQTEAKVESVLHSFLQLRRANPDESDEEDHKYFMDEDDDNFQFTPAYARDAAEGDGKPAAKKKGAASRKAPPKRPAGVKKKKAAKSKKRK